jgi:hypothetical protein
MVYFNGLLLKLGRLKPIQSTSTLIPDDHFIIERRNELSLSLSLYTMGEREEIRKRTDKEDRLTEF